MARRYANARAKKGQPAVTMTPRAAMIDRELMNKALIEMKDEHAIRTANGPLVDVQGALTLGATNGSGHGELQGW